MFHPGRVVAVLRGDDKSIIGADKSVQAVISMWDDNLLTCEVDAGISEKIKETDIVLVDYSPKYQTIPVPRQIIVKILRGEIAKKVWAEYLDRVKKRKMENSDESDRAPEAGFHVR